MPVRQRVEPKVVRQEVYWIPASKEVVLPIKESEEEPYRVWTLYGHEGWRDPNVRPTLPIKPIHNHGAFLEDFIHDWNVHYRKGVGFVLGYYSRVVDHSVWILCEYVDRTPRDR